MTINPTTPWQLALDPPADGADTPATGDTVSPVGAPVAGALDITVHGRPITQGSKVRNRYGGVRDDNAKTLHPWRDNVRSAALEALRTGPEDEQGMAQRIAYPFGTDSVEVVLVFYFDRPTGHFRTGRNAHLLRDGAPRRPANRGSGDIDKLQRACFDSLTDAMVWKDDCQVVDVRAIKRYVGAHALGLDGPGVVIHIRAVP